MEEVAPGIRMIDSLLGGMEGVTAIHLVSGERTALVDAGARTSAPAVLAALAAAGLGAGDLAAIVLTHVHLDHCGATGALAAAFPRARVVVHRRGARHLAEPGRLVAASAAVYGARASLYGGLDPTPPERITAAEDGHVVDLGGGRRLVMLETPGHARHHMAVLDEGTGTVLAGDALGARFADSGLYPALPPPDVDPVAGDRSLRRLAGIAPERLQLAHFGSAGDPGEALDLARRQLALMARAAGAGPEPERIAAAVEALLPLGPAVGDADALRRWRRLGWAEANIDGLAVWARAELL